MTTNDLTLAEKAVLAGLTLEQKAKCAQYDFHGLKWFLGQMKRAQDYREALAVAGATKSKPAMKIASNHVKMMKLESEATIDELIAQYNDLRSWSRKALPRN